jgi:hypothetical protein
MSPSRTATQRPPREFERATVEHPVGVEGRFDRVVGEFWTAGQRS